MLNKIIRFFLENKLVTAILLLLLVGWGIATAPFNWKLDMLPRDPVAVDAIPDIGENQQIVFTKWAGRSPQDIEDQVTYPLTTSLLGIPGVKTIRSSSMFGFSSIYIIFEEGVEFCWSRSRILEKLNSLPADLLPDGVQPQLGPDATALGQIYWYTLEGRDKNGKPTGGWDLQELRSVQDYYVRYALSSAQGVAEVASIGGYVKEYQVDVDPAALKAYDITLDQVIKAVQNSNLDVGARTVEINQAEYLVRGLGYVKELSDIENAVITARENVPIRIKEVAKVSMGPASRRGILDKSGAEVVGGVVVARYGSNPLEVINNVKEKIATIEGGLPSKTLDDGTVSQLTIIPFYDRTGLIKETLGTLEDALTLEIIITIIVVILMVLNLRASILISGLLPIAVLMTFIAMRYFGVDANIVALSGIAIAIGTMVDLGIILTENILEHLDEAEEEESRLEVIYRASAEVAPAIVTAVTTTIISFIPVFALQGAEGKLFSPLAFTKTFALIASIIVSIAIIPAAAHLLLSIGKRKRWNLTWHILLAVAGVAVIFYGFIWAGAVLLAMAVNGIVFHFIKNREKLSNYINVVIAVAAVTFLLAREWLPLGPERSVLLNFIFVLLIILGLLGAFALFIRYYKHILSWCLEYKKTFLAIPALLIVFGLVIWMGFNNVFGFVAKGFDQLNVNIRTTKVWSAVAHQFPGIGEEFMPSLDEGSFLLMPTTMPHAGVQQNKEVLQKLDMAVTAIPEVEMVVGKAGRVESALDPAPLSMFENIINYKPEYITGEDGKRKRFAIDDEGRYWLKFQGEKLKLDRMENQLLMEKNGSWETAPAHWLSSISQDYSQYLLADKNGQYFRQWRDHIQSPDDIWQEIVSVTKFPGLTSAPKLQPIETRLVMLQTGMRAPMGIKVQGPDLRTIEQFGFRLEDVLKKVPSVKKEAVFADRIVGKPYLQIDIDRQKTGRYGLSVKQVQQYIEVAIGGMALSKTVEGRERYPIRVRYPRELRDDPETIGQILIPTATGTQIQLREIADIEYIRGPQVIKSEDTFLIGYVLFDKKKGHAEVDVVEEAQRFIKEQIETGELQVPAGVTYEFTGNYENQVRAEKRLSVIFPLVLLIIFMVLYFQFRSVPTALMVFAGVAVAFAGGFIMLWLYGEGWFMDFSIFGSNLRDLFQMKTFNLSVAVWVGFIALFGIATDDGVVMATYLKQVFEREEPKSIAEIRKSVMEAGSRRVRPCLMTTATTILALLPILTSTGRGADIMIPMAIPAFGGMTIELITLFVVPVLYSWWREGKVNGNR